MATLTTDENQEQTDVGNKSLEVECKNFLFSNLKSLFIDSNT